MKKVIALSTWLVFLMCMSLSGVVLADDVPVVEPLTAAGESVPGEVGEVIADSVASASCALQSVEEALPIEEVELANPAEIVPIILPLQPAVPHTEDDVYLLAQLIHSEAGIESRQCKMYVGSVVLNRMSNPEFPSTLSGVIFDRKYGVQFSVTLRGKNGKRPIDNTPSQEEIDISRTLLVDGSVLPSDVLVFYSTSCDSGWVTHRKKFGQVDHTIFAYMTK